MGILFTIAVFAAVIGAVVYGIMTKRKREKAMAAYAMQQGWTALGNDAFTLNQYLPQYIQNQGQRTDYDMAYQATVNGVQLVFFQYSYTEYSGGGVQVSNNVSIGIGGGSAQNSGASQTYTFTVVHAALTKNHPNLLLLHHTMLLTKLRNSIEGAGLQKLSLEGDFNDYFDTYIAPGTEVEALSLLTPDVMQMLVQNERGASLQFNGQSMMVSLETADLTPQTITPLLTGIASIVEKIDDRRPEPAASAPPAAPAAPMPPIVTLSV